MTRRAIVIGLLASAIFAGIGFFNDMVMKQTFLFSSYMPAFVYGLVMLFVLVCNPVLARFGRGLALSRNELAAIIVLTFPACFVSGRTLVHHFPATIITPKHYNRTRLGWQRYDLLRRVPPIMLAGQPPELRSEDIISPAVVRQRLLRAGDGGEPTLASRLAAAVSREDLQSAPGLSAQALARILNRVIRGPALLAADSGVDTTGLPVPARDMLATGFRNAHEERCFNRMLVDAVFPNSVAAWLEQEEAAVQTFQTGLDEGSGHVAVSDIPWGVWTRPLLGFWLPLLLALCVAYIGFALVAQRQWAEHEHLPFPIVTITEAILPDPGSAVNRSLFRNRIFWAAVLCVAALHLNNYAVMWWPGQLIEVSRSFSLSPLARLFPVPWDSWRLFDPIIYFTIVGMAYLISSEASLSVGLAPFVYALIAGVLGSYGIVLGGAGWNSTRTTNYVMLGGYLGLFVMLLYSGRQHFLAVARGSIGRPGTDRVQSHERWGVWVFLAGAVCYVMLLWRGGIQPFWGLWYFLMLWVVYTVVARIVAETGMILIHPVVFPSILAVGFVGEALVGLDQVVPMVIVSTVIGVGCHVVMLPLMTQGLRLTRGGESKAAIWCTVSLCLALAVAIPSTIYFQYDYGATYNNDGWTRWLPYSGLDAAEKVATKLDAQGVLSGEEAGPGLAALSPPAMLRKPTVIGFLAALIGVVIFETMRLRFRWWPFHPIMFVVLDFWVSRQLAVSFLLGWLIKTLVCRYGGTRVYRQLRPAMFGLIAGDIVGQMIISLICAIYALTTGSPPKAYWVLPG